MWVRVLVFAAKNLLGEEAQELIGNIILAALVAVFAAACWLIYMVSMAFQGGGLWWLAIQNPKGQEAFAQILAEHGWTKANYVTSPTGVFDGSNPAGIVFGPVPGQALPVPPADQWAVMQQWADGRAGCTFQSAWIAARAWDESKYGANMATSSAGAIGYGQFLPSTWALPGIGLGGNPYDFHDAIPAMARYFCQAHIDKDPIGAQLVYNHSLADADYVAWLVSTWSNGAPPTWRDHPMLNQYAAASWATPAMFGEWRTAACSAATLWWMAGAYGQPLPNLDVAVDDELPAIDPTVGLRDHTGAGLAAAYTRTLHMTATNANFSQTQLVEQLKHGPVALDGFRWFGVGHWFVATAADQSGISVRESSGNNITHLSWSQLFGEVGWDGWSVFFTTPAQPANAA